MPDNKTAPLTQGSPDEQCSPLRRRAERGNTFKSAKPICSLPLHSSLLPLHCERPAFGVGFLVAGGHSPLSRFRLRRRLLGMTETQRGCVIARAIEIAPTAPCGARQYVQIGKADLFLTYSLFTIHSSLFTLHYSLFTANTTRSPGEGFRRSRFTLLFSFSYNHYLSILTV